MTTILKNLTTCTNKMTTQFILGTSLGLGLSGLSMMAVSKKKREEKEELNDDILELVKERMEKGRKEYGHGLIRGDRDWTKEALEEALDMSIYLSAKLCEIKDNGTIKK